jgi:hypothetical protein
MFGGKSRLAEDFYGFPEILKAKYRDNISFRSQPRPFKSVPIHRSFILLRFCEATHQQIDARVPFHSFACPSLTATRKTAPDTARQYSACSSVQSPPGFCTHTRANKWGTTLGAAHFASPLSHLREERRPGVFEIMGTRGVFGVHKDEIIGGNCITRPSVTCTLR